MFIASSFNEIHALLAAVSEFLVRILFFPFQQAKGLLTFEEQNWYEIEKVIVLITRILL